MLRRKCSCLPILPSMCLVTRSLWLDNLSESRKVVVLLTGNLVTLVTECLLTAMVKSTGPR